MNIYIVEYDLNSPGKDYTSLYREIQNTDCVRAMESAWLIRTPENATQVSERIRRQIDRNDFLLVSRLSQDRGGWLPKSVWTWIEKHSSGVYSV